MTVQAVLARLEAWLREHRSDYLDTLEPPASAEALAALAAEARVDDLGQIAELYAWSGGQQATAGFWHIFEFRSPESMTESVTILTELREYEDFPEQTWRSWVPFLESAKGYLCVDFAGGFGGTPGQVIEWWSTDAHEVIVTAPSLDAWLEVLVTGLERDLWTAENGDLQERSKDEVKAFNAEMLPGYPRVVDLSE